MLPHEYTLESRAAAPLVTRQDTVTHTFTFQDPPPRILACDARTLSCRIRTQDTGADVTGEVELRLFTSNSGTLSTQSVRVPYSIHVPTDSPAVAAQGSCLAGLVRLRREGNLAYRAECPLEVSLRAFTPSTTTLLQDISDPAPEMIRSGLSWLRDEILLPQTLTIQEDVLLDPSLPQVGEILTLGGQLTIDDCHTDAGEARFTGHFAAYIFYTPKDGGAPVTAHFIIPVTSSIRHSDLAEGGTPTILPGNCDVSARVYADVQGEDRLLHVNADCEVTLFEARTENATLVCDAFALDREFSVTRQSIALPQTPLRRQQSLSIRTQLPLEGDAPKRILYTLAKLQTDSVVSSGNGSRMEATLTAQVLCLDASDAYRLVNLSAPLQLETDTVSPDPDMDLAGLLVQADVSQNRWNLSGTLTLNLSEYPVLRETLATGAQEGEALAEPTWNMKLLIAGEGDSLWTLARRSRVRVETLENCNPQLACRPLAAGDAVIVYR